MSEPATTLSVADGVATITLNRPESRNALSAELINSLGDVIAETKSDRSVRVMVLTNAGNTFCAGADLKGDTTFEARYSLVDVFDQILDSPIPVIGRIAGHCMGGGVGLAAACDISVVADDAKFGFTEVRIGVAPAVISVVCLPKLRRADANELFLSGERITAARAKEVGLINHVVPAAGLDDRVAEVTAKVVAGGPKALAAAKLLIAQVPDMDRAAAFEMTGRLSRELFESEEAVAGIGAWRAKEPAPWAP